MQVQLQPKIYLKQLIFYYFVRFARLTTFGPPQEKAEKAPLHRLHWHCSTFCSGRVRSLTFYSVLFHFSPSASLSQLYIFKTPVINISYICFSVPARPLSLILVSFWAFAFYSLLTCSENHHSLPALVAVPQKVPFNFFFLISILLPLLNFTLHEC